MYSGQKLIPEIAETPTWKFAVLNSSAGFDRGYAQTAINMYIPDRYIQGYNYQMVEEELNNNKEKLMFTGPKGVGKSACLVALWHKYIKDNKKVILIGINTIKMFFQNHKIQCYLQSLNGFATSEYTKDKSSLKLALSEYIAKENPIVLLDLTLTNAYEDEDDVLDLVMSCNTASHCLVAMSSGSGSHFSSTDKVESLDNALLCFTPIEFIPFTKAEAVLFVRLKGVPISCEVQEENALITNSIWSKEDAVKFVKKLKPYAGHNPYLMIHALTALGDAKELDVEARTIGICIQKTQQYIERTLPKENSPSFFLHLQEIVGLLHSAKQKAWINEVQYMKTFVYKHRLAYIVDYCKHASMYVKVAINYPLLPGL